MSSISAESASQSAIWFFDCSMAHGHASPTNKAQTTVERATKKGLRQVCFTR